MDYEKKGERTYLYFTPNLRLSDANLNLVELTESMEKPKNIQIDFLIYTVNSSFV